MTEHTPHQPQKPKLADYIRAALADYAEDHPDETLSAGDAVLAFDEALRDAIRAAEPDPQALAVRTHG